MSAVWSITVSAKALADAITPEKTEQAADAPEGASAAPITADKVADGTYPITVDSSSNMFRIVDAQLIVENGSMHCVMTLSGTGYGKLFMGTGDEATHADCYCGELDLTEKHDTFSHTETSVVMKDNKDD